MVVLVNGSVDQIDKPFDGNQVKEGLWQEREGAERAERCTGLSSNNQPGWGAKGVEVSGFGVEVNDGLIDQRTKEKGSCRLW